MSAASRVRTIVRGVNQIGPTTPAIQAWALTFGVESGSRNAEDEVSLALSAFRSEIDLMAAQLGARGVPSDLYANAVKGMRSAASPSILGRHIQDAQNRYGKAETLIALDWAVWLLADEDEAEVAADQLTSLAQDLDDLGAALAKADLSDFQRDFITRQIATIRTALRLYAVQGSKALEQAYGRIAGDAQINKKRLERDANESHPDAPSLIQQLGAAIKKTAELADAGSKIKKGIEDGKWLIDSAHPAIEAIFKSLSGPG